MKELDEQDVFGGGAGASVGVFLFVTETNSRWGKTVLVQVDDSLLPQGGAFKEHSTFQYLYCILQ